MKNGRLLSGLLLASIILFFLNYSRKPWEYKINNEDEPITRALAKLEQGVDGLTSRLNKTLVKEMAMSVELHETHEAVVRDEIEVATLKTPASERYGPEQETTAVGDGLLHSENASVCSQTYLTSVDVGLDCYTAIFHDAGCTADPQYTDWVKSQTGAALVKDSAIYASLSASATHAKACHGTVEQATPKQVTPKQRWIDTRDVIYPASILTPEMTGPRKKLATKTDALHKVRAERRSLRRHFQRVDVPVYVLTLGGKRKAQILKELKLEGVTDYVIVEQPTTTLKHDYPISKSQLGCTSAHIAFALALSKANDLDCAVVVEDDASFALSSFWPFSLRELCNRMFERDPEWTTLMLYSSDTSQPHEAHAVSVRKYTEGTWGTVSYLATSKWADKIIGLTQSNTRMMKSEIGSLYGTADSVLYAFRGSSGYVLHPNYVFPNNAVVTTTVQQGGESSESRDSSHIAGANSLIEASQIAFGKIKPVGFVR